MRDTMRPFRIAIYNLTLNQISFNGEVVKFYDEKKKVGDTDNLYFIFSTQQETQDNTSDTFITRSRIDLELHHKTGFEVSKDVIDDVSDQFYRLLLPTPMTDALPVQNLFQIMNVVREGAISRNFSLTDSQSDVSKIITIAADFVEQEAV